ncbi:MAG: PaaI family thioesterase [Dehalococcoidia bacterium]|nr:PaaI family thioesterase [Dehalococcoidia bacterium]
MSRVSHASPPDGFQPAPGVGFEDLIGPLFRREVDGIARFGFRVAAGHVNGRNAVHGGMLVAFADMAWGKPLAVHGYDAGWATVRLTTDFIAPAPLGAWVEASSAIIGRDGDLFTVRGEVHAGDQVLLTGSAIYKGFRRRPGD